MAARRLLAKVPGLDWVTNSWQSLHDHHWMPQFYICDVCRLNYDYIFHTEDDVDSKNSIIDQLDLGIKLLTRDEYYKVRIIRL